MIIHRLMKRTFFAPMAKKYGSAGRHFGGILVALLVGQQGPVGGFLNGGLRIWHFSGNSKEHRSSCSLKHFRTPISRNPPR